MQGEAMSREGLQLEMRNEKLAIIAIIRLSLIHI